MDCMFNRARRRPTRRGATAVEGALLLPIVIMFLLGILEYGRYVMTIQILTNASREGAHYALAHTEPVTLQGVTYGNSDTDVVNNVNRYLGGQRLTGQTVSVFKSDSLGTNQGPWINASAGEMICVRISGTYNFLVPQLLRLPSSRTLSVQSVMRSEGN